LITNGEFTAFNSPTWCTVCENFTSTHVMISPSAHGPVKFVNSAFWGPSHQIALHQGPSSLSFSSCTFVQWDINNEGLYAIQANNGNLILKGNDFAYDAN